MIGESVNRVCGMVTRVFDPPPTMFKAQDFHHRHTTMEKPKYKIPASVRPHCKNIAAVPSLEPLGTAQHFGAASSRAQDQRVAASLHSKHKRDGKSNCDRAIRNGKPHAQRPFEAAAKSLHALPPPQPMRWVPPSTGGFARQAAFVVSQRSWPRRRRRDPAAASRLPRDPS